MIASRTGVPVVGVVPFVPELKLPDEDAAAPLGRQSAPGSNGKTLFAAVLRLPHISNFDDFDPLRRAGVQLSWVASPEQLTGAHLVIIPGTKSTIADLRWMKACRLDRAVAAASGRGAGVLGICGGYQMLCHQLEDPLGADSNAPDSESGLGLLDGVTVFAREKTTRRVEFDMPPGDGLFAGSGPVRGRGYEIHTGQTASASQHMLKMQGHEAASRDIESRDGAVSAGGWVAGTYVHGLFDNPPVLARLLGNVARRHGLPAPVVPGFSLDAELDRVAGTFRSSLDMQSVLAMTGIGVRVREQEAVR
jgi:adenosylcobyric acid synthase